MRGLTQVKGRKMCERKMDTKQMHIGITRERMSPFLLPMAQPSAGAQQQVRSEIFLEMPISQETTGSFQL